LNEKRSFDIVGRRKLWYSLSLAVIVVGWYFVLTGNIRWGIDFTGGGIFRYRFSPENLPAQGQQVAIINTIRQKLNSANITTGTIQFSGKDQLYIRTSARNESERKAESRRIMDLLSQQYPGIQELGSEVVGPVIGKDLTSKAIIGVILGNILIAVWIWLRYNFMGEGLRYSVCGIVALIHDVLVLLGLFALACKLNQRIEADSAFVAALLTVVGYSINDTVVIFDRIRENLHLRRRDPFGAVVNDSLLQTMTRSINTVLTVELTLLALFFFGGETIHSFILALIIGISAGTYSSIFLAGPLLVSWKALDEKKQIVPLPTRRKEEQPAVVTSAVQTQPLAATPQSQGVGGSEAEVSEEMPPLEGVKADIPPGRESVTRAAPKSKKKAKKSGKRKRRY